MSLSYSMFRSGVHSLTVVVETIAAPASKEAYEGAIEAITEFQKAHPDIFDYVLENYQAIPESDPSPSILRIRSVLSKIKNNKGLNT